MVLRLPQTSDVYFKVKDLKKLASSEFDRLNWGIQGLNLTLRQFYQMADLGSGK